MLKSRIARAFVVVAIAACAFSAGARAASAQTAQQQVKEAPASVSGRVTIEGRGAAGVVVGRTGIKARLSDMVNGKLTMSQAGSIDG